MSNRPPRQLRRQTLIATARDGLSEGVLVVNGDRTIVEIVGGPPFATLDLFAAQRLVGSVTLDQLGSGSAAVAGVGDPNADGCVPLALRYGSCTVLEGSLSMGRPAGAPEVGRS